MRRIILPAIAVVVISLIWACSAERTEEKAVAPITSVDTARPTVMSTFPADGDSNVAMDVAIRVVFSEEMNPATINEDCFFITGGFDGTVDYHHDTAVFTPAQRLDSGAEYYAVVHLEVTDTSGNHMEDNYHWRFYTIGYPDTSITDTIIPEPDSIELEIVAVAPADGTVDVPYTTAFTVTFSKNVDPLTLTDSSFFLSDGMPGKITVSGKTATLTPAAPLGGNRVYTVTVTTTAADVNGHHPGNDYTWSVTTEPVEIMPLTVGNRWIYHDVQSDTLGHVVWDGYDTLNVTGTAMVGEETWYQCTDGYKYTNRTDGLWKACQGNVLYRQFPTTRGASYQSGSYPDYYCSPSLIRVTGVDTVITVPAGTFHCITYYSGDYYGRTYYHYAPNVGLVRSDSYMLGNCHVGSSVLTEYTVQ